MVSNGVRESPIRNAVRRVADRALARIIKLPPATNRYSVIRGESVPMRDGVDLIADRYVPETPNPIGTVLIRAPYGRGYPLPQFFAQPYAARGMHVVIQSVRGTHGSSGDFFPGRHEPDDGQDTVQWMRRQPWYTGGFTTIGASYLGMTQWALLNDAPPDCDAAVIICAPHDYSAVWRTGSFDLDNCLKWSLGMARPSDQGVLEQRLRAMLSRGDQQEPEVPSTRIMARGRTALGEGAPWWETWIGHPDRSDPYWEELRFSRALATSNVPVLLVNGWQDVFLEQTLEQYDQLRVRGVDVAMTVGPWSHARMLREGVGTFAPEAFEWLSAHMTGRPVRRRQPVRINVVGDGWQDLPAWPPAMPEKAIYLAPDGGLSDAPPAASAAPSTFTYDPADPTPSIGGRLMVPTDGGYRDDRELARRHDVLSFTGAPLTRDWYLVGSPFFEAMHSADTPHADLMVRISEVDAEGVATNVTEGYLRLTATTEPQLVRVPLDAVAHRFPAGARLRVLIAGGSFPLFAPNHGTGEPVATAERLVPTTHHVHHGQGGASRLLIPAADTLPGHAVS